ncbi:LexA repressor [bioreactor metagenome]|uniref:LexA repressor n=1 Tax=bioreactor metagenome TaxID=1076179 RepID=A0A644YYI7_9ZZZZ
MFGEQLRKIRESNNISQKKLGEILFVSQQTVAKWESNKSSPNPETLAKIAEIFKVSIDNLMGVNSGVPRSTGGLWIPVLGRIAAGIPIEAIEDIIDYEEIDHDMASTGVYFGLQIKGDSMAPRVLDGDVVIVRQQQEANTGDIVVAIIDGQDATVKQLKMEQGGIALVPWNPTYEVLRFTCEEVKTIPVTIIGVVYELRGKFLKF